MPKKSRNVRMPGIPFESAKRDLEKALRMRQKLNQKAFDRLNKAAKTDPAHEAGYIYLDDETHADRVVAAIKQLAEEQGIVLRGDPPVIGSFKQRLKLWFTRISGSEAGLQMYSELQRAIALRTVDEVQSKVDLNHATGAAALIASLEGVENAAIQLGSTLLLKVDGKLVVRTLNPREMDALRKMPSVLNHPASCLGVLQSLATATDQLNRPSYGGPIPDRL
jgi:hypothetical protein